MAQTAPAHMQQPPSPTLTNPDMILPYGGFDSSPPPPRRPSRPPSPPGAWKGSRPEDMQFSLGLPLAPTEPLTPTTPIIYGNGTMLSDIGEVTEAESTHNWRHVKHIEAKQPRNLDMHNQGSTLHSSPAVGYNAVMKRSKTGTHERKVSVESTSTVTSEPQAAEMFQDFDDGMSVDDSNFQGDDEESVADGPYGADGEPLNPTSEKAYGKDVDRYSSAALSRRAELILANAKKRLDVSCLSPHRRYY